MSLRVSILPDVGAVPIELVLQACLYFDEVIVDGVFPRLEGVTEEGLLQIRMEPVELASWSKELEEAGILRRREDLSGKGTMLRRQMSMSFYTPEVRKAIADSLKVGADCMSTAFVAMARGELERYGKAHSRVVFADPLDTKDELLNWSMSAHLVTFSSGLQNSREHSLVPLVGRKEHARMISVVARAFPEIAESIGLSGPDKAKAKHVGLAHRVMDEYMPGVGISTAADVLEIRDGMKDELERFRTALGALAADIKHEPWSEEFEEEIERTMAKKIRPSVSDLRARLGDPGKRFIKHMVRDWKAITVGSAFPMVAMVIQGAGVPWAAIAGLGSGVAVAGLRSKLEEWDIKRNSEFVFLFEMSGGRVPGRTKRS